MARRTTRPHRRERVHHREARSAQPVGKALRDGQRVGEEVTKVIGSVEHIPAFIKKVKAGLRLPDFAAALLESERVEELP